MRTLIWKFLVSGIFAIQATIGYGNCAALEDDFELESSSIDPATIATSQIPTSLKLMTVPMGRGFEKEEIFEGVHYFTPEETSAARVFAHKGRLYDADGKLLNTKGNAIFVIDPNGNLFVVPAVFTPLNGRLHHSSLLRGGDVALAGSISVVNGTIVRLDNGSGHYTPTYSMLMQGQRRLREMGVAAPDQVIFIRNSKESIATSINARDFFASGKIIEAEIHEMSPPQAEAILTYAAESGEARFQKSAIKALFGSASVLKELQPEFRMMITRTIMSQNRPDLVLLIAQECHQPSYRQEMSPLIREMIDSNTVANEAKEELAGYFSYHKLTADDLSLASRLLNTVKFKNASKLGYIYGGLSDSFPQSASAHELMNTIHRRWMEISVDPHSEVARVIIEIYSFGKLRQEHRAPWLK